MSRSARKQTNIHFGNDGKLNTSDKGQGPHAYNPTTLRPGPWPTSVTAKTRFPQGTILYHLSCRRSMKPDDL